MDVEGKCQKSGEYWVWVREEARKISSDGCTRSLQIGECCCLQHDLCFHYGRDPRSAFKLGGDWSKAEPISFTQTNMMFAGCLPWFLKYRFLAVQSLGYVLWRRARAKDGQSAAESAASSSTIAR